MATLTFFGIFHVGRRDAQVRKFLEFYQRLVSENKDMLRPDDPLKRPSVIAHSFGTFIVANCLYRHEEIKIDKLILLGSVLPIDFEWQLFFCARTGEFRKEREGFERYPSPADTLRGSRYWSEWPKGVSLRFSALYTKGFRIRAQRSLL